MLKVYTNQIVVTQDLFPALVTSLHKAQFHPNIYVLKSSSQVSQTEISSKFAAKYFDSYEGIIC